jgi:hypothetical protein
MKKIFYLIVIATAILSSCSDELDLSPISSATPKHFINQRMISFRGKCNLQRFTWLSRPSAKPFGNQI